MVKARITSKGLIQEPGSGLSIEGSSTFSGVVTLSSPVTASQGMVFKSPSSGSGPHFSLTVTGSDASSATSNAILLHTTGSDQGTNIGIGASIPDGATAIFFDPNFQPEGAGSAIPSIMYKVGNTVRVISSSVI